LDSIIANGSGGIEGISDLRTTDLALVVGSVAPHSSEAVRLQLKADRQRPSLTGMSLLQGPHVPLGPKQVLHMVTVLVGDHVGLRKISALRMKALLQLAEETQIQVHLLIRRTIERARLGASGSAATVGCIAEKDQFRGMVPRPFARQFPVPECLNIGLDADDEPSVITQNRPSMIT
jgi:hypothetical protein